MLSYRKVLSRLPRKEEIVVYFLLFAQNLTEFITIFLFLYFVTTVTGEKIVLDLPVFY